MNNNPFIERIVRMEVDIATLIEKVAELEGAPPHGGIISQSNLACGRITNPPPQQHSRKDGEV